MPPRGPPGHHGPPRHGSRDEFNKKITGYEWIRLIPYIKNKFLFFTSGIFVIVSDFCSPATSVLRGQLATVLVEGAYSDGDQLLSELNKISTKYIGIILASFVFRIMHSLINVYVKPIIRNSLRESLVDACLKQEIAFFDSTQSGILLSRLTEDVNEAAIAYTERIIDIVRDIVKLVSSTIIMFAEAPVLAKYMLIYLPIITIIDFYGKSKIEKIWGDYSDSRTKGSSMINEVLKSMRTVRGFNGEINEYKAVKQNLKESEDIIMKNHKFMSLKRMVSSIISDIVEAAILYIGGTQAARKEIDPGVVIVFMSIKMEWTFSCQALLFKISDYEKSNISAAKLLDILERKPEIKLDEGVKIDKIRGKIEFRDVVFKYKTRDTPALNHVSFTINPGETVAIVGESGCGKSTILQLIERFYDCQEGQILIDDIDVKNIAPCSLRKYIGYVPQGPIMFAMNIKNNIRYGKPTAQKDEIINASKIANAHSFIIQQKNSYNTDVNQESLSGGQKQRICIARAVIIDAPVLLLDEATASLDSESELLIQNSIKQLKNDKTMVIVAHRLSTIKNADRILVVDSGKIVEEGTHSELLSKEGFYANLVRNQLQ